VSEDRVDEMVAAWRRERPDLGRSLDAMATIGRLGRLSALGGRVVERGMAEHGLTVGDFDVLAALRRSGEPYELTPSALSRTLMLSPGGITSRIDRLETAGLVDRRLDPGDRRSFIVGLSQEGRRKVDDAVTDHVACEDSLLSPLSRSERAQLDDLLRRLLAPLEP
jgi:DNA-binding MarR family transcriptional regulator